MSNGSVRVKDTIIGIVENEGRFVGGNERGFTLTRPILRKLSTVLFQKGWPISMKTSTVGESNRLATLARGILLDFPLDYCFRSG